MVIIKIAIYGKGGIGKSTISSNISAALSQNNKKILQIGCDPKHDSTRLLLGGRVPNTVLDYIKDILPDDRKLDDIVFRGYGNIACVEAGGPEPGVGCAGRGIITTFELLESLGLGQVDFDYEIYDVLGDVVCGGFAVPIRKEYAEAIYLITSGEFMAIYAANNILKGIKNFGDSPKRVAGIIYNSRNLKDEDYRIKAFSNAVKLPIVAKIPRSNLFASAEKEGKTVVEAYPASPEANIFRKISEDILNLANTSKDKLRKAIPLNDEELESIVLGIKDKTAPLPGSFQFNNTTGFESKDKKLLVSESVKTKHPLHGCAFAGAACVTVQIQDAYTLLHCPRSCAHMIWGIIENSFLRMNRLYDHSMDFDITRRMGTTNMGEDDFIFGGEQKLRNHLQIVINNGWKNIFVVTACPPGIIGDNISLVAKEMMDQNPDVKIEPLLVDGNLQGDFSQGYIHAFEIISRYIKKGSNKKIENTVNIIGEKSLATNEEYNFSAIKYLLDALEVSVNTRFITRTNMKSIHKMDSACLNLPAHDDFSSRTLSDIVSRKSDLPMLDLPFPTGFHDTSRWLLEIAGFFDKIKMAEVIINAEEQIYLKKISDLKDSMRGKRLLISTYSRSIDWILELATDLEMDIIRIGLMYSPTKEPLRTRFRELPIREEYNPEIRKEEIKLFSPDLVLLDRPSPRQDEKVRYDIIPYSAGLGFQAGLYWAERWYRIMKMPHFEEWRLDGEDVY